MYSFCIGIKNLYRYQADNKLLDGIDEKTKRKLIDDQKISVIDRKTGFGYLKYLFLKLLKFLLIWFFSSLLICLYCFLRGYGIDNIFISMFWLLLPGIIIFLYFFSKDILKLYLCKRVCIINAFCCDVRYIQRSRVVSIVYYDFKKSKLVMKSIMLNEGNDDLNNNSFCHIIVGERKNTLKVIDIIKNNKQ